MVRMGGMHLRLTRMRILALGLIMLTKNLTKRVGGLFRKGKKKVIKTIGIDLRLLEQEKCQDLAIIKVVEHSQMLGLN